jgi:hypothetical protein
MEFLHNRWTWERTETLAQFCLQNNSYSLEGEFLVHDGNIVQGIDYAISIRFHDKNEVKAFLDSKLKVWNSIPISDLDYWRFQSLR